MKEGHSMVKDELELYKHFPVGTLWYKDSINSIQSMWGMEMADHSLYTTNRYWNSQ